MPCRVAAALTVGHGEVMLAILLGIEALSDSCRRMKCWKGSRGCIHTLGGSSACKIADAERWGKKYDGSLCSTLHHMLALADVEGVQRVLAAARRELLLQARPETSRMYGICFADEMIHSVITAYLERKDAIPCASVTAALAESLIAGKTLGHRLNLLNRPFLTAALSLRIK